MSGRKPHNVYVYDEDGTYICMFESISEFRAVYYPNDIGKRPIFTHKELDYEFHHMEDLNLIAFNKRPGRDLIRKILAIHKSEYCKPQDNAKDNKPVLVFNLKQECIAEFKNARLLLKLMPHISPSTLHRHLNIYKKTKSFNDMGLFFVYKPEELP
jgi:hypothetical protein